MEVAGARCGGPGFWGWSGADEAKHPDPEQAPSPLEGQGNAPRHTERSPLQSRSPGKHPQVLRGDSRTKEGASGLAPESP